MPKGKPTNEKESVSGSIFFTKFDDGAAYVQWVRLSEQLADGTFVNLTQSKAVDNIAERLVEDIADPAVRHAILKQVSTGIRKVLNESEPGAEVTLTLDRNVYLPTTEPKARGPKRKDVAAELSNAAE